MIITILNGLSAYEPLKDLKMQLRCLKWTWILIGLSILKFSFNGAGNVKQYDLNAPMKIFKRHELLQAKEFFSKSGGKGKFVALLYHIGFITSRCIFISLMIYYVKEN